MPTYRLEQRVDDREVRHEKRYDVRRADEMHYQLANELAKLLPINGKPHTVAITGDRIIDNDNRTHILRMTLHVDERSPVTQNDATVADMLDEMGHHAQANKLRGMDWHGIPREPV